jgi:programmed cell death 6-interacting protein
VCVALSCWCSVLNCRDLDRFDAFTHKPTSQYSLAYEKASIIFNISAVLSCHGAHQNRHEDVGLKTAYHSFQAAAGMFTYINENFLHAPSTDLSRETVKTLVAVMLAQAQEVFLEKQVADGKKVGLLAKLASQAAFFCSQAVEGVQDNVTRAIFEKVWLLVSQVRDNQVFSLSDPSTCVLDHNTTPNPERCLAFICVASLTQLFRSSTAI